MRILLSALLFSLALLPAAPAQNATGVGTLNVLSWNIFMRPAGLFWDGQLERAKHIGALLKDSDYDVLVFQEAFGKKSLKLLRDALEGEFPYEVMPSNKGKIFNNGLWVVSRLPIENVIHIFYDRCSGVDCGAAKGAVFFEVTKDGFTYQVINTHMQSEEGEKQTAVRNTQFAQMREVLEEQARTGVLQLIAGDMNTALDNEEAYKEMVTILNAEDGDVCMPDGTECATASATTWGCPNNTLIPDKWKGNTCLLDYVLVRDPKPRERPRPIWTDRVLRTFTSPWSDKHRHLSDHYAISIRLIRE